MSPVTLTSPRPVVALDVDGVLNISPGPGIQEHRLHVPAALVPKSPFLRGYGEQDLDGTLWLDPTVGPWIQQLRTVAHVVWATTWEHLANTHLAPLLGIDPLPVACAVHIAPPRYGYVKNRDSIGWKASVLMQAYPNRPLVWVDDGAWNYTSPDENTPDGVTWSDWRYPWPRPSEQYGDPDFHAHAAKVRAPSLALAPRAETGLDVDVRTQVDAFVADPYHYVRPQDPEPW